jgi:hypothetical protein
MDGRVARADGRQIELAQRVDRIALRRSRARRRGSGRESLLARVAGRPDLALERPRAALGGAGIDVDLAFERAIATVGPVSSVGRGRVESG